jgi:peptide subunit release factor 1 (eRF1)
MSMTASKDEVMERAVEIGQQAERRREAQLVQAVVTGAAKGQSSSNGLEDTLAALHEGRIQTLLIKDGFRAPGYLCKDCGYLTSQNLKACPFCSQSFESIQDAVELSVHQVMKMGGDVEVLREVDNQKFRDIGAVLRY